MPLNVNLNYKSYKLCATSAYVFALHTYVQFTLDLLLFLSIPCIKKQSSHHNLTETDSHARHIEYANTFAISRLYFIIYRRSFAEM